ncbi:Rhodanese-like domain protein [Rhodovulum sp. P5]|nr:Rhodanese-like domain protein [Rhodovulum sp. P5]
MKVYPYVEEIRAKDAWEFAEKGEIVLIDVREPHEIARFGKCRGAIHIPMHMTRHKANRKSPHFDPALDPAKTFAFYCENGSDAIAAARVFKKLGYENVYNMGAFREWLNAKLPVEK